MSGIGFSEPFGRHGDPAPFPPDEHGLPDLLPELPAYLLPSSPRSATASKISLRFKRQCRKKRFRIPGSTRMPGRTAPIARSEPLSHHDLHPFFADRTSRAICDPETSDPEFHIEIRYELPGAIQGYEIDRIPVLFDDDPAMIALPRPTERRHVRRPPYGSQFAILPCEAQLSALTERGRFRAHILHGAAEMIKALRYEEPKIFQMILPYPSQFSASRQYFWRHMPPPLSLFLEMQ